MTSQLNPATPQMASSLLYGGGTLAVTGHDFGKVTVTCSFGGGVISQETTDDLRNLPALIDRVVADAYKYVTGFDPPPPDTEIEGTEFGGHAASSDWQKPGK